MELHGTQVDELVQLTTHPQQDVLLEDTGRYPGMADGAEEDGVGAAQGLEVRPGQGFVRPQVALATEVDVVVVGLEAVDLRSDIEDLHRLAYYLGAGPIAGDLRYGIAAHSNEAVTPSSTSIPETTSSTMTRI